MQAYQLSSKPKLLMLPLLAVLLLFLLSLIEAQASPSPRKPPQSDVPRCDPVWNVVSSPNPSTGDNALQALAAISASDVWASGYDSGPFGDTALIEHWDGNAWSVVPGADLGTQANWLYGLVA